MLTIRYRKAIERLQAELRDRTRTHYQPTPAEKRRGLGFMADPKSWAKRAHDKSPMKGRKA